MPLLKPIPVPRKKRESSTQLTVPCPEPQRTQRSTAGVHTNPDSLPKSACNLLALSPDMLSQMLSQVLAGMVLYTSGKIQGGLEYNKQQQIKLGWALFLTYTIIQSIMRSEMCSLHLTHPSVHTWSSGQPGSSRGFPARAGIQTHNLGLPRVSSPTLYPLGQRLPVSKNSKLFW